MQPPETRFKDDSSEDPDGVVWATRAPSPPASTPSPPSDRDDSSDNMEMNLDNDISPPAPTRSPPPPPAASAQEPVPLIMLPSMAEYEAYGGNPPGALPIVLSADGIGFVYDDRYIDQGFDASVLIDHGATSAVGYNMDESAYEIEDNMDESTFVAEDNVGEAAIGVEDAMDDEDMDEPTFDAATHDEAPATTETAAHNETQADIAEYQGASASERFIEACRGNNVLLLEQLLEEAGTPEEVAKLLNESKTVLGYYGYHEAVSRGHYDLVDRLLDEEDFEVDPIAARDGNTPLHSAMEWINKEPDTAEAIDFAKHLLGIMMDAGSDPNIKNKSGNTPLDQLSARKKVLHHHFGRMVKHYNEEAAAEAEKARKKENKERDAIRQGKLVERERAEQARREAEADSEEGPDITSLDEDEHLAQVAQRLSLGGESQHNGGPSTADRSSLEPGNEDDDDDDDTYTEYNSDSDPGFNIEGFRRDRERARSASNAIRASDAEKFKNVHGGGNSGAGSGGGSGSGSAMI